MRLKLSQLKILIENFVNEEELASIPAGREIPPKQNKKDKKEFIAIVRGTKDKDGLLEIKKGMEKNYKSLYNKKKKYLEGRETGTGAGKLKEYEEDFLRFLGKNKELHDSFKKSYTSLIKEFNKERKESKKLFKEKGEDQIQYRKYLLKAKELQELEVVKKYINEESEYEKGYEAWLGKEKKESDEFDKSVNWDEEIEDSMKSDADRDEDELKTIRGNKMIDKDLRDVLQSLKLLKKVSINKKTKRGTKIKINRQIDMIIRDIMGSVPKEKSKQERNADRKKYKDLNLDEAVNRFVRRLIRENVDLIDNKSAIKRLKDLNTFLSQLGDEELESTLRDTTGKIINKVTKTVQRYVDRKEGDFFDENYEMKSPDELIDELEKSDLAKEIQGEGDRVILYATSDTKRKKLIIKLGEYYGYDKTDKDIIDNISEFIVSSEISSIKDLINKLETDIGNFKGGYEKTGLKVIEQFKDPDTATGRKRDREIKTDLEIIEGHANLSGLISNYLKKDSKIKKILKSSADQETRKDQVIRLLMNKFNDVQEFKEKIIMLPLTDADVDEYDELNLKKTKDLSDEEKAKLAKLTRKIENKDKYERGKRIRNFIEVLVVGSSEGKSFKEIEQKFAREMQKQKDDSLDTSFEEEETESKKDTSKKQEEPEKKEAEKKEPEKKEAEKKEPEKKEAEKKEPNKADEKIFKKYIFSSDDKPFESRTFKDPGPMGVNPLKIPLTAIKGFKNPFTDIGKFNLQKHASLSKSPWKQGSSGNKRLADDMYLLAAEISNTGRRSAKINIHKKSNNINLFSPSGGKYYDIAVDGTLGNNHIIRRYVAVRETDGIFLIPFESQSDIRIAGKAVITKYIKDTNNSKEIKNGK